MCIKLNQLKLTRSSRWVVVVVVVSYYTLYVYIFICFIFFPHIFVFHFISLLYVCGISWCELHCSTVLNIIGIYMHVYFRVHHCKHGLFNRLSGQWLRIIHFIHFRFFFLHLSLQHMYFSWLVSGREAANLFSSNKSCRQIKSLALKCPTFYSESYSKL